MQFYGSSSLFIKIYFLYIFTLYIAYIWRAVHIWTVQYFYSDRYYGQKWSKIIIENVNLELRE